MSKHIFLILIF